MEQPFIRTLDDFLNLVTLGKTPESLYLDFKGKVDATEAEWQQELCRDVAQFANTWGGCLLVGIDESKDPATGLKVASRVRGVTDPDAVRSWVEQAVTNHLVPSTLSHDICFVPHPQGVLVAVNVPASRSVVYVADGKKNKSTIECLRRTNHGKGWMNPDEMERHMMNGSRAAKLAFLEAKQMATHKGSVEVLGGIWRYLSGNPQRFQPSFVGEICGEQDTCFELVGRVDATNPSDRLNVTIPFDLVRSVWVDSGGRVTVLLSVRLLYSDKSLAFEPTGT